MKPLKITLLLAVFVISFSGSNNIEKSEAAELEIQQIDKQEFKLFAADCTKKKKPNQNI